MSYTFEEIMSYHPDKKGFVNLSNNQDEKEAKETIGRLEQLAGKNAENPKIAIGLAKSLVNLSNNQDERGVKETIGRLGKLVEKNLKNRVILKIFQMLKKKNTEV